ARKFAAITRWGRLEQALEGLAAAKGAGLAIKIDAVALKDVNGHESASLLEGCDREGFDLTLIEVMPMGDIGGENRVDQYLPLSLVRARAARGLAPDGLACPRRA